MIEEYKIKVRNVIAKLVNEREIEILSAYYIEELPIKQICKDYVVSDRIIYKLLKDYDIGKRPTQGKQLLDRIKTDKELYFYLIGLIASDGYVYETKPRIEINLQIDDCQLLEDLSYRIYNKNTVIYDKKYGEKYNKKGRARLFIYGKEIVNEMVSLGITQRKSESLKIDYSSFDLKYFNHFLRGYFDGDGCLTYYHDDNIRLRIDGNLYTMDSIKNMVKKLYKIDSAYFKVSVETSFDFYRWVLYQNESVKLLLNILYKDSSIFLDRKYKPISKLIA